MHSLRLLTRTLGRRRAATLLTLLSTFACAPAALAGQPTTDGFGNWQQFDVQAYPAVAGAGIVFDLQQTYWNSLGLPPRAPHTAVIRFPRGGRWNGDLFPQCELDRLRVAGPAACPAESRFATAEVLAAIGPQAITTRAAVSEFVGTPRDGHPTQLLYAVPEIGPPFVLVGEFRDETAGPYGPALHIDLTAIPGATPLAPSPIVITSIHNLDIHTSVTRTVDGHVVTTPLIVAPETCDGTWKYAFESVFPTGPALISTSTQPCVPRAATASRRARSPRRHVHRRPSRPRKGRR